MPDLRYPIGEFRFDKATAVKHGWARLRPRPRSCAAVEGLDAVQLDTSARSAAQ